MKEGDKLISKDDSLLNEGETYFFDHEDIWDDQFIYVKCIDGLLFFVPKELFYTVQEFRKLKLEKLNESRR